VPRDCGAAVCVPVSTAATPLGTLWVFADEPRDFSDAETNMLEITAGRMAAELEREMLLGEIDRLRSRRSGSGAVARSASAAPPPAALDGWDIAAWRSPLAVEGRAWLDWFAVASDQIALSVGRCDDAAGQATEAAARAAARAASSWNVTPQVVAERANHALWGADAGDLRASLAYVKLDTHHGLAWLAMAGDVGMTCLPAGGPSRETGSHELGAPPATAAIKLPASRQELGADETIAATECTVRIRPGDSLLLWAAPQATDGTIADALASAIAEAQSLPLDAQARFIGESLAKRCGAACATLVLRRRSAD
jgi:hypothetical protein